MCREEIKNCHFGEKCWFLHMPNENEIEYQNGNNQDYLEKLFDMVEKFTNRIIVLENKMNGQMIWYIFYIDKDHKKEKRQIKNQNQVKILKRTNSVFEGCIL